MFCKNCGETLVPINVLPEGIMTNNCTICGCLYEAHKNDFPHRWVCLPGGLIVTIKERCQIILHEQAKVVTTNPSDGETHA